jgi:RimJ/RimL family protein N-acetyltransferase
MFINTTRTIIRPFIPEDQDNLALLCGSYEAMRYIPPHFGIESGKQIKERLNNYIRHHEEYGISFGIVYDHKGNFLGRAGFYFVPEVNLYEIGYSLLPEYWGRGYATELVKALLDYAFNILNLDAVCARTIIDNYRSANVLDKTGFTYLGERAFSIREKVFLWNYYEKQNEDILNAAVLNEYSIDDWDIQSF